MEPQQTTNSLDNRHLRLPETENKTPTQNSISKKLTNIDAFSRKITYLRISLTDRCNMRCLYCMPASGIKSIGYESILKFDELYKVIKVAVEMGVRKIRLTGGEPLVRKGLVEFVRSISALPGLEDIAMTTNGVLLKKFGKDLYEAGVKRLNISLDSLNPETFARITRTDYFKDTCEGIEEAEKVGFSPIKLNVVVQRGINDHEVLDFANLAYTKSYQIRFIEFMPVVNHDNWKSHVVSTTELISNIESKYGELEPLNLTNNGNGPAKIYRLKGGKGIIGFISAMSKHFCNTCNRLRLTADGKLRQCLFSDNFIDIREPLRQGATDDVIKYLFFQAIQTKPEGHKMNIVQNDEAIPEKVLYSMASIGG